MKTTHFNHDLYVDGKWNVCTRSVCVYLCMYVYVMVAVGNQFSNERQRKKWDEWNHHFFLSSLCTSLVDVVPSAPSQGSDESNKNFDYYVTVSSFFSLPLSLSLSTSFQDKRHVCIFKKKCNNFDIPDKHKHTIHLLLTVFIDKINNDYYLKKSYEAFSLPLLW